MFQTDEMFSLKGRTAVITGGLTGLGLAITRCMVGAGAKAVVLSREEPEKAERILEEFEGRAVFYQFNVTDTEKTHDALPISTPRTVPGWWKRAPLIMASPSRSW